jgi:hypothetical protein
MRACETFTTSGDYLSVWSTVLYLIGYALYRDISVALGLSGFGGHVAYEYWGFLVYPFDQLSTLTNIIDTLLAQVLML